MENQEMAQEIARLREDLSSLRGVVKGNGSVGHEQRIAKLEVAWDSREGSCFGLKAVEQMIKEKEKKRTWRIGDVANIVQLLMLMAMIYGMFFI